MIFIHVFRHIDTTHSFSEITETFAMNFCHFLVSLCFNFYNFKLHHLLLLIFFFYKLPNIWQRRKNIKDGKLQLLQWAFQCARAKAVREQMEIPTDSELYCLFNTVKSSFQLLNGDLKFKTATKNWIVFRNPPRLIYIMRPLKYTRYETMFSQFS